MLIQHVGANLAVPADVGFEIFELLLSGRCLRSLAAYRRDLVSPLPRRGCWYDSATAPFRWEVSIPLTYGELRG